jgi:predicted nucleic acid-binding protein
MAIFVVDASAALAWCFEDEASSWADGLLERLRQGDRIMVPAHWPTEISNGLLVALRRKRIKAGQPALFWDELARLPIEAERNQRLPPFKQRQSWLLARSMPSRCMTRRTWS